MTVLNDDNIRKLVEKKVIKITPEPYDIQYQPASLDLRLDDTYLKFRTSSVPVIDTRCEQECCDSFVFTEEEPLVLQPGEFVLAQTVERVKLPRTLLGRVEGRSSVGRLGVAVHVTAGFIDPGFDGNITLEIVNLGNIPVVLYPYQRVCQIVFEEL